MHELTSNAVEPGRVAVSWRIEPTQDGMPLDTPVLALDWAETGGHNVRGPARRGFGTDVLEEMLAYAIGACAALTYEPDELRCGSRPPLTRRVGRLIGADASAAS